MSIPFWAFLSPVIFISALLFIFFLGFKFRRAGMISRSLNLGLLLVRFPLLHPQTEWNIQQLRERIALMEQLYSHFYSLKEKGWKGFLYGRPSFALELTIPSIGEEISFYVAVPRRMVSTAEKLIHGIFPDAYIEESRDYNIFNPEGAAVGSRVTLRENSYSPLRTYMKIESDPLGAMTNVFTKLAKEGEGASVQIVARPAPRSWIKFIRKRAKLVFEGKKGSDDVLVKGLRHVVKATESGMGQGEGSDTQHPKEPTKLTPLEEEIARGLEAKVSKHLFEANIRLLASAPTKERSESILHGLESAFLQYSDPNANSFSVKRVEGRVLEKLIFNFSFRNFDSPAAMILNTEELTSLFHFPNVPLVTPKVRMLKAREAPPPVELPYEGLLLGYNLFRGEKRDIYLLDEDRRRHLYIIGQTGTGKTTLIKNLIIQDVQNGKGVCVIDPHGDMVESVLGFVPKHRMQDVIYFNPGDVERPMGLNMLEYDPNFPEQKTFIVNELLSIFDKLYNMSVAGGPMFEQYFRNSTLLVMDDPSSGNTLLEIERVLADSSFRQMKLSRSNNIVVKNFWTQIAEKAGGEASLKDIVPYIVSKFDNFVANEIMRPIIAQEKSAFNFREIMDSQKILLVNLSKGRLGDLNSSLIGLIIVGKLLMAALSRADMPEERRKDFYLYIDEFQNVTTDSIATILSEARKYRLDLTITHQFIGQLKEEIKKAVFGNVGSMMSFRIGTDDAEFVAKQFKPQFGEEDLLNIDNFNSYVKLLLRGGTARPFSMKSYPTDKGDAEITATVKEISRIKYGRPREEVEAEIREKMEHHPELSKVPIE